MPPTYPLSWKIALRLALASLRGQKLPFRQQAQESITKLTPPLHVLGREHIPVAGPCVITTNHYTRPGFQAWWFTLAISAVTPVEIHWTITAAWTFEGHPASAQLEALSQLIFRQIAYAFDFTLQEIQRVTYGTHELTIAIRFGDSARKYRWLDRY